MTGAVFWSRAYKSSEPDAPGVPFQNSIRVVSARNACAIENRPAGPFWVVLLPLCSEFAKLTGTPVTVLLGFCRRK